MTARDSDWDDDLIAALLATTGRGAPAPDPALLEQLRVRSTEAFLAVRANLPPRTTRSAMTPVLVRLSAFAAAAAVLIAAGIHFLVPSDGGAALGEVLDRVSDADTLHLRLTRDGQTGEAWATRDGKLRWDAAPGRYEIAHGEKLYRIDEPTNKVTPGSADYFRPDRPGLAVLALMGVVDPGSEALRDARTADAEGLDVYRLAATARDGTPLRVEVQADAATGRLRAVQAFADKDGRPRLVASLALLDENKPVPAEKFKVPDTLSEDGRVGKVFDAQGVVGLRPLGGQRWTPARPGLLVMPGDWVRADIRGANAAAVRLLPRATVTVGPGGLVEVTKPTQLKLHEGEAEVSPDKGHPVELTGPAGQKLTVKERAHYRVEKGELVAVAKEPLWLKGFKGATANESIGSLVAQVDGRSTPLSVGYHKVTVDIRDQIARTTIEESFVNHTPGTLEGVFHFPLPPDASISGFGMWIGNELVEADVVEKQRAREIYEQIMREKRDPGLLEWTGGNVFKARVWPIFGHSDKRIKISYTQVLPLRGGAYRYSYALQSEMLQQNPLKELQIKLTVSSAAPIKSAASPTHSVRVQKEANAATLEFSAQEHTPTKDFEAVIEVADQTPEVVLIPHRRGDDGYFLMQVTSPAAQAGGRGLLADGGPLELLVVCDTSASMDPSQRSAQRELAAALLGALTPKDTFNLACCDVGCDWAFDRPQPATAKNLAAARNLLAGRVSLGWTDLDKAFASALKQAGPKAQVVYLGDGIATTGDANPQAFADRLKALYQASGSKATLHAVALGSAFEAVVLKAAAGLNGGSVRRVSGEQGPAAVALELLGEITTPPVRDLKVEFAGLKVAGVYPEALPNLVPGTQQILLGRYKPQGNDQQGEVTVAGRQGDREVRYTAKVSLKDAESGNSFIPRLWARMHLDKLLERPQTDATKDDIIALSEEYNIITPYTSFLVLESDADRERFKVKRRFQMRDGERYFAEGRDKAEFELAREQMKRAGDWRLGLRRNVLAQLAMLGRDPRAFEDQPDLAHFQRGGEVATGGKSASDNWFADDPKALYFGMQNPVFLGDGERADDFANSSPEKARPTDAKPDSKGPSDQPPGTDSPEGTGLPGGELPEFEREGKEGFNEIDAQRLAGFDLPDGAVTSRGKRGRSYEMGFRQQAMGGAGFGSGYMRGEGRSFGGAGGGRPGRPYPAPTRWFDPLFPGLAAPPAPPAPAKAAWPAEARDLARSLLRREALAKLPGGLRIERTFESFDVRDNALTGRDRRVELYSPTAWAARSGYDAQQTLVEWCDGKGRATFGAAFQLGQSRAAVPADLRLPPLDLGEYAFTSLDQAYGAYTAAVEKGDGVAVLVLRYAGSDHEVRYAIDPARRAVVKEEHRQYGKVTSATTYGDFVEAHGLWWPRKVEVTNADGRRTRTVTQAVTAVGAGDFARELEKLTAGRDAVQFVRSPAPTVSDAKKALAAGKATFDDRFTLLNYYAGYQQWEKANEQLDALEKLAAGKPGVRWLRTVMLHASRRGEELRQRLGDEADKVVKMPAGGDRLALADFLFRQAQPVMEANELRLLLDRLRPAYEGEPKHVHAMKRWKQNRMYQLQNAGQAEEALALRKELATEYPHDYSMQYHYAQTLFQRGEPDAAYAWLKKVTTPEAGWSRPEADSLRELYASFLEQQGRLPDLIEYLAGWLKLDPETESPYRQYLSALVRTGEGEKAYDLIARWMKEARLDGEIPAPVRARYGAAVGTAVGRGHNLHTDRIEDRWLKPLGEAALFFAGHAKHPHLADAVLHQWHFQSTDEGHRVRKELVARLAREVGELSPARLAQFVGWVHSHTTEADAGAWKKIADGLRVRWLNERDPGLNHSLGDTLETVLQGHVGRDELLAFLHQRWKQGPEGYRAQYARRLFDQLLQSPWTDATENDAVSLLGGLAESVEADARLLEQLQALYRLTDRMVQARHEALMNAVEHPEKLTRVELTKKKADNLKKAREGFADRLRKAEGELPEPLRPWLAAERLYLEVKLGRDLKAVAAEVWKALGNAPKVRNQDEEPTLRQRLDGVLAERHLAMALYLASRQDADPELVKRTLGYLDRAIAAAPADAGWKATKLQLLVALDRPKDLEAALGGWLKGGDADGRWRTALGYLLAEQGRLKEAIKLFEAVEKADELGYAAYRALAGWYMAVNDKDGHDRALVTSYKMVDEGNLSRLLYVKLQPWQRGPGEIPSEFDVDVLRIFKALFEKSSYPQNYVHQLQQFYAPTRDFRLLATLTDAVMGQTANKIYPFIQNLQPILGEVRDEATADELFGQIEKLRKAAKTATDLRALDLFELQASRRAAELINQPGPHVDKAVAALKRAYDRGQWSEGEPRLMSDLLAHLGHIAAKPLADEQLRQLRGLHEAAKPGTHDRLHMAHNFANVLGGYQRHAEGIALLHAALDEFAASHGGVLPAEANGPVQTLVAFHETVRQHAKAEDLLVGLMKKPANPGQEKWLAMRLDELYHRTLQTDNTVSLGSGKKLYQALERRLIGEMAGPDPNHRNQLVALLCAVYHTAQGKAIGVGDDLKAFAHKKLPGLLKNQPANHQGMVGQVAGTLRTLVAPGEAVAFLMDRIEEEPAWFKLNNQDGWAHHGWSLAQYRSEAMNLGNELEGRLLKLVLAELKADLRTQRQRNRAMYYRGHTYYWSQREIDFAAVAEEVYAKHARSEPAVLYVADYFYSGCNRPNRGIDVLYAALEKKLLGEAGQVQLVGYLHGQNRFNEAVTLLVPLVEKQPDNLQYRVLLLTSYHRVNRRPELLAAFAAAEKHFRDKARWHEGPMATLANSAMECEIYDRAKDIYNELIPLHQRSHANRGIGDGTLSHYYGQLARACSALGLTDEAVDAAGGAIVSWGANINNRTAALQVLQQVLAQAKDLDAYVGRLDKQTAETGLVNPVVRKALGQVYFDKGNFPLALAQLQTALDGQPNDAETLQRLIDCHDRMMNPEGAVAQVLRALELNRRDIQRYDNLGQRLDSLGKSAEAERAYTSIVEVLPNESEGHALLAEVRQRQGRWAEAIGHWEQVAKIRALEPTGLLKLAHAQLHEKQFDKAAETVKKLKARPWPAHFSNEMGQIPELERQLREGRKQ